MAWTWRWVIPWPRSKAVERVERVRTKNGRHLECDLVVAGIGIMPKRELLTTSGAAVNNGVLVDERCRTSLPDVYAAGDVANHLQPVGHLRVEHWNNGFQQGRAAARRCWAATSPLTVCIPSGRTSPSA